LNGDRSLEKVRSILAGGQGGDLARKRLRGDLALAAQGIRNDWGVPVEMLELLKKRTLQALQQEGISLRIWKAFVASGKLWFDIEKVKRGILDEPEQTVVIELRGHEKSPEDIGAEELRKYHEG